MKTVNVLLNQGIQLALPEYVVVSETRVSSAVKEVDEAVALEPFFNFI